MITNQYHQLEELIPAEQSLSRKPYWTVLQHEGCSWREPDRTNAQTVLRLLQKSGRTVRLVMVTEEEIVDDAQDNRVTKTARPLEWLEGTDNNDNTTWCAQSCLHDEGCHFAYRVDPILKRNAIWWSVEDSDSELVDGFDEWEFATLEAARQACEALERQIVQDAKAGSCE